MFPLFSVPTNPGPTEWDIISIDDEPMSIADTIDEEIDTSDDSNTSEESSNSSEERSVGNDAAENDLASVTIEDPVEDDDIQDIQAMLDAIKEELGDVEDDDFHEMQAMLEASMEEDLGDSDNESCKDQAEVIDESDELQDFLDEQNRMQEILDEQNSFSSESSKADSANQINQGRVIFGLDQQKTIHQKVSDWFDKN